MKRVLALILALLTAVSLSACEKSDGRVKKGSMTFTNRNFPKICTDELSKRHAAVLAGAALSERKDDFAVIGLEAGIESLISGVCDIFIAAVPTEKEALLSGNASLQYGKISADALVFMTDAQTEVPTLDKKQIIAILSGTLSNWSEAGGSDGEISVFDPPSGSLAESVLRSYAGEVTGHAVMTRHITTESGEYDGDLPFDGRKGSFGVAFYSYAASRSAAKNGDIRMIPIDGVAPGADSISDGTYIPQCGIYVIRKSDIDAGSAARVLYDWMLSHEAAAILSECGIPTPQK